MKKRYGIVGTPFQIVRIAPKVGQQRSKTDCFYYKQGGKCSLISKCCGATGCPNFMEHRKANASLATYQAPQKLPIVKGYIREEIKKVGCRVYHKGSMSSYDGGPGTVIKVNWPRVMIEFDSGRKETFLLPDAFKFLRLIEQ